MNRILIFPDMAIVDLDSVEAFNITMDLCTDDYILSAHLKCGSCVIVYRNESLAAVQDLLADTVKEIERYNS